MGFITRRLRLPCRHGRTVGDADQLLLRATDRLQQSNWIQSNLGCPHLPPHLHADPRIRQQPLIQRCPEDDCFSPSHHRGASRKARRTAGRSSRTAATPNQRRQRRRRLRPLIPAVADGVPDHGAIHLFHPGLVVLPYGRHRVNTSPASQYVLTVSFINTLSVSVSNSSTGTASACEPLALQHRPAFHPARCDVRQRQRLHVAALRGGPRWHQVRLDEPRRRISSRHMHRVVAPDRGRTCVTALSATSRSCSTRSIVAALIASKPARTCGTS